MHASLSFLCRVVACLGLVLLVGCSLRQRAVNTLAEVLGEGELVYLRDEDTELVGQALPFNIKTIETLLESSPEHQQLLPGMVLTVLGRHSISGRF